MGEWLLRIYVCINRVKGVITYKPFYKKLGGLAWKIIKNLLMKNSHTLGIIKYQNLFMILLLRLKKNGVLSEFWKYAKQLN